MDSILGLDIGGTTINGGRIEGEQIVEEITMDTKSHEGGITTINIIKEVIRRLKSEGTKAIGVGVPSVVDRNRGVVYNVQNIRDWEEVHLKSLLEKEFGLPVWLDNDANCFAYGEKIFGKGRPYENFVGITLGTGVGGGIIQQHHLLHDSNCGSGEFGEIPYLGSILEDYCGSHFFTQKTGRTAHEIALAAAEGDNGSLELYHEYGKHMAALVKIISLILDPQAIIFGGSISQSFGLFEKSMYEGLKDYPYPKSIENLQILTSELKNIGVLGAGALCIDS
ncbi:MAG: ROK family protein [bacterium]|nr:ROK family protein [bacterium]